MPPFYSAAPHMVQITGQGFDESKEKRTPFFFLEFAPYAEQVGGDNFRQIDGKYSRTLKLYITKKTVATVRKRLAELGWAGNSFSELEPTTPGVHSFVGVESLLICSHVNGYEEWDFPYDGPAAKPKESDPSLGRKLDALFGKSSSTAVKKPAAKKDRPPQNSPVPTDAEGNQDIPF